MSDLLDDEPQGRNAPEFSVSEITGAVKRTLEGAFGRVRVKGEVGRVVLARSGHLYFDLKDDRSVIASVAWKGVASRLATKPEEGMEVIASGKLSTFGPQSKYQLIVDDLAPAGLGALMVMLEKRRQKLAAEGLFAPERKAELPYLPEIIGVVTSPSGAVIRDILHRLRDRFPRKVLLWPVTVQGERSAPQVAAAIRGFNALTPGGAVPRPDVLIVARGGGSIEDLWGFNEEAVVRAAADSQIPLISAVGHETDTTLIDYAADMRAPTPTAAAELAVPVRAELIATLASLNERRIGAGARAITIRRDRLTDLARLLPRPAALVTERAQRFDALADRLPRALQGATSRARVRLEQQSGGFGPRLLRAMIRAKRLRLDSFAERLDPARLSRRRAEAAEKLAALSTRLKDAWGRRITRARDRIAALERIHASLDHRAVLSRGFALVKAQDGTLLPDAAQAQKAGAMTLEFRDGRLDVATGDTPKAPPKPKAARSARKTDDDQGSLF